MIRAESFIEKAREGGFELYTGVPCSYLKPFINYVIDSPSLRYIGAANEGDAIAIAAGADLAGKRSVVMFQNSGFGNAVNPLTSLNAIFEIPSLVITTLRGEPGGPHDEPQHKLMGQITTGMFELLQIPWEFFPTENDQIAPVLERAISHMTRKKTPYGLVMKKDSVESHKLKSKPEARSFATAEITGSFGSSRPSRTEVLRAVQSALRPSDVVIATTGYTGRELYALEDKANQLYMVGSMGCASTFGLGVAWAQPNRRVIVLDGDGAALMRLGALATLGYERPRNLVHILLDNELHESTGGQSTVAHSVDLAGVAKACGYPRVTRTSSTEDVAELLRKNASDDDLTFAHVKMRPGAPDDLPRPTVTPVQVAERLRAWLKA